MYFRFTWPDFVKYGVEEGFLFAALVSGSALLAHLLTATYIAQKDISGQWDTYRLRPKRGTLDLYLKHLPSLLCDFVFVLFPCLFLFGCANAETVLFEFEPWSASTLQVALWMVTFISGNFLNRVYAYGVHRILHLPWFYRTFHKAHHCPIDYLCATEAWRDTFAEFFFMEVFGVFLFAHLFVLPPMPLHFHVLMAVYNGVFSAVDHSAFYVPGTIFDSRYHFSHHYGNVNKNLVGVYGEILNI